jgi:hypothetical protein
MTAQETNAYRLGYAVGLYDPNHERITYGCLSNLIGAPHAAPGLLRHVWPDMAAHPTVGPILASIDFAAMPRGETEAATVYLGFAHGATGRPLSLEAA